MRGLKQKNADVELIRDVLGGILSATIVACGPRHALVLLHDGTVLSWGYGAMGRLGHGDAMCSYADCVLRPVRLAFFATRQATVRRVACGLHHTLAVTWEPLHGSGDEALLTARVFGWGFGDHGRLGSGGGGGACRSPARVLLPLADNAGADTEAARGAYPCDIAAGDQHSMCLLTDGSVYVWGDNAFGQLPLGATASMRPHVLPLQAPLRGVTSIACGSRHSAIAFFDGKMLLCGFGEEGQLGGGPALAADTKAQRGGAARALFVDDSKPEHWAAESFGLGVRHTVGGSVRSNDPNAGAFLERASWRAKQRASGVWSL
ncbi:regulator of chromosome condensation 1/beta-lactamase-inhibitor protein II [Pelagophyceae sp. CCMP2097]|nr:regulator of chromosome condensation 1/beta-lactamase-inhibitor protein II [Pelagophyceae sp. CCMP2097]